MASGFIGLPASLSIIPWALNQATQPLRATRVTEPESRFSSISRWTIAPMRSRRWADKPTDSGLAVGSPWAKAVTHPTMASQKTSNTRAPRERTTLFIRSPPFLFHREDAKTRRIATSVAGSSNTWRRRLAGNLGRLEAGATCHTFHSRTSARPGVTFSTIFPSSTTGVPDTRTYLKPELGWAGDS